VGSRKVGSQPDQRGKKRQQITLKKAKWMYLVDGGLLQKGRGENYWGKGLTSLGGGGEGP